MPGEPSAGAAGRDEAAPAVSDRSRSFAELIATLERLNHLESAIVDLVSHAQVPRSEVRRLLRCETALEAGNAPAMQFMRQLFRQVGLSVTLVKVHPFHHVFEVPRSPYTDLLRSKERKPTCYLSSEAISRFFERDLGLGCTTEEVTCINAGDPVCTFNTSLEQEDVREALLDRTDRHLLKSLHAGEVPDDLRLSLDLTEEELDTRLEFMSRVGLVSRAGQLTEAGNRLARAPLPPAEEDEGEPPWHDLEQVTEAVSTAASFAQAVRESAGGEFLNGPVDPGLVAEARECRSFAELIGRSSKKHEEERRE